MACAALSQPCRAAPQQRQRTTRAHRSVVCAAQQQQRPSPLAAVRAAGAGAAAAAAAAILLVSGPASAELNQLEAQIGGEFGIGSAQQYGEADVKGRDFSNQDLRRANFTAAGALWGIHLFGWASCIPVGVMRLKSRLNDFMMGHLGATCQPGCAVPAYRRSTIHPSPLPPQTAATATSVAPTSLPLTS